VQNFGVIDNKRADQNQRRYSYHQRQGVPCTAQITAMETLPKK
jgi:hypothetical protein